jgi:hypothetical protein
VLRIRDVYSGSRISDSILSIPDPGSRVGKIPDPIKHSKYFLPKNRIPGIKVSKIRSGMFKPDPGSWLWIFPDFYIREEYPRSVFRELWNNFFLRVENTYRTFLDADSHPESGINIPDPGGTLARCRTKKV